MKNINEMGPAFFALLLTILLTGFVFLARRYAFEAWIQYHYRVEPEGLPTPQFLIIQRDLWWAWFAFPLASAIILALTLWRAPARSTLYLGLLLVLLCFVAALVASQHATFSIWLSAFGRIF